MDARIIFEEAEDFLTACKAIKEKISELTLVDRNRASGLNYTYRVNHAFAFELYLKCLQVIETDKFSWGHELYTLFDELSETTKTKIINHFESHVIMNKVFVLMNLDMDYSFKGLLIYASNAFTENRYLFKDGQKYKSYNLHNAIDSVKAIILEMKPDFKIKIYD